MGSGLRFGGLELRLRAEMEGGPGGGAQSGLREGARRGSVTRYGPQWVSTAFGGARRDAAGLPWAPRAALGRARPQ